MLNLRIKNEKIEKDFLEFAKTRQNNIDDIALEAIKTFLDSSKNNKIVYRKKNAYKHMHKIRNIFLDEDLKDIKMDGITPFSNIKNSALYTHNFRRQNTQK